jgi:hypothetical protein
MNAAAERIGAFVLALSLQICGAASHSGAAAQPAPNQTAGDGIVPTFEVLEKVRAARQNNRPTFGADANVPGPLPQVSDYPIMTVNVDPADPADFVVAINEMRYHAGARMFRVVPGHTSIIVTRRGREPCKATLEVTASGPNVIACQL